MYKCFCLIVNKICVNTNMLRPCMKQAMFFQYGRSGGVISSSDVSQKYTTIIF